MNYLNKIVHGNLLEDNFTSLSMAWELSPNIPELIIENENSIELLHGEEISRLLIDEPESEYTFCVKLKHEPFIMSDIAGVVILSDQNNYIEVQSYDDDMNNLYNQIKIDKRNNRYLVYAKREKDSLWQYIGGSTLMDVTKIGFFVKGTPNEQNSNLEIESVLFDRSTLIGFDNITENYFIELYDEENNLKAAKRQVGDLRLFLDTKVLDTPLKNYKLIVKNEKQEEVLTEFLPDIYGGDVFIRDMNLTFFINGYEIDASQVLDFGKLDASIQYVDFAIRNNLSITENNKKVIISPVSNFYKGDEIIFVSELDNENNPIEFKKSIIINKIDPLETVNLRIKLDRTNFTQNIFYQNDFKAKIIVE